MTTTLDHRLLPAVGGGRLVGAALAALALLLLASGTATAQDNDDDGVLPAHGGTATGTGGSTGSGGTSSGSGVHSTADTTILIAGHQEDDEVDPRLTHVELSTEAGGTDVVIDAGLQDATYTAGAGGLAVSTQPDAVRVQGAGELVLQGGLSAKAHAADVAVGRHVLLVLDDGSASLDDVLAGKTQPDLVVSMGDLLVADLVVFHRVLMNHAGVLPGVHATLVFGSVDFTGELHLTAIRGSTDGDPLEVASR